MAARSHGRLARWAAGISGAALGLTVAAQAAAQSLYGQASGGRFKAAPHSADVEAAQSADMIFGIHANTLFFVAAGLIAVFWFTVGGGRKAKLTRE